ncbi:MAG TPA: hypothetical protein VKR60_15770, partial [Candidatus Sulfotelmatobacter sp.]|nr:hypothetical protein [Candidatus Sulfotelmatobacter sp.]
DNIAVGRDCEIERTQFVISDQPMRLHRCAWSKGHYGVIASPIMVDSRSEEQPPIMTEGKPSRKRHHAGRQQMLSWSIKTARERDDGAFASQADEITPIRAEISTARIQVSRAEQK